MYEDQETISEREWNKLEKKRKKTLVWLFALGENAASMEPKSASKFQQK